MNEVITAYNSLLDLAATGRKFRYDEVWKPTSARYDDSKSSQVAGQGFDFERDVDVADVVADKSVLARAKLRVLKMTKDDGQPTLFLRTWFLWITSAGDEHKSYACYEIDPVAAKQLAKSVPYLDDLSDLQDMADDAEPSPEYVQRALGALFETIDRAAAYNAHWRQTCPDKDFGLGEGAMPMATSGEDMDYHSVVIDRAQDANPELLCMLSGDDFGEVGVGELPDLQRWIMQQPEVAAART